MKNPKRWLYILLCVAAVVAIGVGGYRYVWEQSFFETALPADAFIDDIVQVVDENGDKRTVVTVWYLVDNVEHVCELSGYSPALKDENGKIAVWYQPEEPDYCFVKGSTGYTSLFWIGGVLAAFAVGWAFWKNPFRTKA